MQEIYNYIETLPENIIQSLVWYTGDGYLFFNESLRKKMIPKEKNHFDNIQKAFLNCPTLKNSIIVYKGVKITDEKDMYKKDLAYVSTGTNYESTETFRGSKCCVLQITVSAGSKVLPVYLLSENESEDEILLDKGGNFIVKGSTMKDNMKIIFITYTSENCNIVSDLNLINKKNRGKNK